MIRRLNWVDWLLLVLLTAAIGYIALRVNTHLTYRWNWGIVPNYILRWDEETGRWMANLLLQGFIVTIKLTFWSGILSLFLGLVIALARISPSLYARLLSRTYVELFRNLPPLVLIFIFYFFLSEQIVPRLGIEAAARAMDDDTAAWVAFFFAEPRDLPSFVSGLIVLALFESAFVAEIIRAGIQSIPKGQWEAAQSIGLTPRDKLRFVVLPQAVRNISPALANQVISLVKDSSIISLISIQELTYKTTEMVTTTRAIFEAWITTALMYFAICYGLALVFKRLETRSRR